MVRTAFALLVVALLAVACGDGRDEETLAVAESLVIADLELQSAERVQRIASAGQPDATFATFASVAQVYRPNGGEPKPVHDELQRLAEADGWVVEEVFEDGSWRTAERVVDGRAFEVSTGYAPSAGTVSLRIEERRRDLGG